MQKIVLFSLCAILMFIAQSRADEKAESPTTPVHMDFDIKTQIQNNIPVRISKVIDATTLIDHEDQIYTLTGLDLPENSEFAPVAAKRLAELAEGKKCTLFQTRKDDAAGRVNRMGQIIGHLTCGKDNNWLQGTLLSEGLARVRTTPENNQQASKMLLLEMSARQLKKGLWAKPENQPFTPDTAREHMDGFGLIEGKVFSVTQSKDSIFLNFTSDWKSDFTIGVPTKLRKDFSKLRINLMDIKDKSVRVRGWIRNYNGPYVELDHTAQLEILGDICKSTSCQNDSTRPQTQQGATDSNRKDQFMHTISGPVAPTIEQPDAPEAPRKKKEKDAE